MTSAGEADRMESEARVEGTLIDIGWRVARDESPLDLAPLRRASALW
jgi:hypothetical protein